MSETDGVSKVIFPPTDAAMEAKIKRLCDTMAEFMETEITVKTQIVIVAEVPAGQKAAISVLRRIAENQKKKPPEAVKSAK